jgi:hypothetical protein
VLLHHRGGDRVPGRVIDLRFLPIVIAPVFRIARRRLAQLVDKRGGHRVFDGGKSGFPSEPSNTASLLREPAADAVAIAIVGVGVLKQHTFRHRSHTSLGIAAEDIRSLDKRAHTGYRRRKADELPGRR